MKKFISIITAAAAVSAMAVTANAVNASDVKAGTYNIDVESDSSMFKVVNCDVTVAADGKMTAAVTLSGTGYGKLFVGTGEQAAAAAESAFIPFAEDAEGKYVYTFELPALDEEIAVAAFSTKKSEWYDRKLTFKSDKIPADALRSASGDTSETSEPILISPAPETPVSDGEGSPATGALGMLCVALPAAAAAVVSRKKR